MCALLATLVVAADVAPHVLGFDGTATSTWDVR